MKCLIRYLSLLLCVVSLFLVFSLSANAENLDVTQYTVTTYHIDNSGSLLSTYSFNPFDTLHEEEYRTQTIFYSGGKYQFTTMYEFSPMGSNILFTKGKKTTIKLSQIHFGHNVDYNGGTYPSTVPDSLSAYIEYTDGTTHWIDDITQNGTSPLSVTLVFTPTKNVRYLSLYVYDAFTLSGSGNMKYNFKVGEVNGYIYDISGDVLTTEEESLQEQKESKNLLTKIKDGISNLKDGITNVFNKLGDVVSAITQLPQKLWNLIQEGLKSLFVPDDDYMVSYKENWDNLMRERFGALYEVPNLVIDVAMGIDFNALSYSPYVNIPEVTIPLPDNQSFTFGGYDVNVVPEGFEFLCDFVRVITTCLALFFFVNGLRKRYDNIVGG